MAQTVVNSFVLAEVAGDGQTTGLNQAFSQQLVVRLTDTSGNPLGGAPIYFENSSCIRQLGSPCQFPGAPGHFASGADNATVVTNSAGIAMSPTYYAGAALGIPGSGTGNLGAIGVTAYVVANEAPYFFPVPAALANYVSFNLTEVPLAPAPISVPSMSGPLLGALCLLLVIGASRGFQAFAKR